jgi:hypothetical protein
LYVEDGHKRVIFNEQYANHNTYCDGKNKTCPSRIIDTWTFAFLTLYSWPTKNHNTSKTVSFADDTGIIIPNHNPLAFINEIKKVFDIYMIGLMQTYYL